MGIWACTHLPWHRFVIRKRVSASSEKITCSCGRAYGMNHDVRAILPWEDVKSLYDAIDRIQRTPQGNDGASNG
jgi:hypothetical protein